MYEQQGVGISSEAVSFQITSNTPSALELVESVERYRVTFQSSHQWIQSLIDGTQGPENNQQQPLFLDNFPYSKPLHGYQQDKDLRCMNNSDAEDPEKVRLPTLDVSKDPFDLDALETGELSGLKEHVEQIKQQHSDKHQPHCC